MKVNLSGTVEMMLGISCEDSRRRTLAWLDRLAHWEMDSDVRARSVRLDDPDPLYMLVTDYHLRIFFLLQEDSITVLDMGHRDALLAFAGHAHLRRHPRTGEPVTEPNG